MEWVSSKQLMEAMGAGLPPCSPEAQRVCKHAKDGLVRTRARAFFKGEIREGAADLPKEFWWAGGHEALEQDWDAGAFSSWPARLRGNEEWRAYGVEWHKGDLEGIGITFSPGSPARASKGGGRKLSEHWPLFAAELALWIEEANDDPKVMTSGRLIEKLNGRLALKGIEEMPRSTADETVKAVLSALQHGE
jgi:hypothetical protein